MVGRKIGMTRIFTDDGNTVPVTVLDVSNNRITQIKTTDTDGYTAVQVAFGSSRLSCDESCWPVISPRRGSKPGGVERIPDARSGRGFQARRYVAVDTFEVGQLVDVTGTNKGQGLTGVIKRHHFNSGRASHGNSRSHNTPGSIGWRRIRAVCFRASG